MTAIFNLPPWSVYWSIALQRNASTIVRIRRRTKKLPSREFGSTPWYVSIRETCLQFQNLLRHCHVNDNLISCRPRRQQVIRDNALRWICAGWTWSPKRACYARADRGTIDGVVKIA
jgi:hypothetical protein